MPQSLGVDLLQPDDPGGEGLVGPRALDAYPPPLCGRGVESSIFVGATAAPSAYSPLLRPVLPPTKPGVAGWSDVGAVVEATASGAAVLLESLA